MRGLRRHEIIETAYEVSGLGDKVLALRGHYRFSSAAIEYRLPGLRFEPAHLLTDCRLRDAHSLGGRSKGAGLGDCDQRFEKCDGHK